LRQIIQKLSARAEFAIVVGIAFLYFISASLYILISGVRRVEVTSGRVVRSIFFDLLVLGVIALILHARGWNWRRLGLAFSWRAALAGIPLFVFYLLLYYITATFVLLVFPSARTVWAFQFTTLAPFWLMVVFFVVNSVFEEVIVTGYVIESLTERGAAFAITASTLLRFSYHLYQGPLASLGIIPLGLLFGALYWQRRTLWPLMVAHTIANVVAFGVTPR
jgi:membrane protease YdiL (CAAX protease family)